MLAIDTLIKGYRFIKRYIFKYPLYVCKYSLARFVSKYKTDIQFYSDKDFFDAVSSGKSIIRLGDGEIGLLHGRDIHYQKHSKALEQDIRTIIHSYTVDSPYILCIPLFVNYSNKELRMLGPGKLSCWLPLKVEANSICNKKIAYADPHFSYDRQKMLTFFKASLYGKKIVFVTNKENINEIEKIKNIFDDALCIETKSENAFETKAEIIAAIENSLKNKTGYILVVACGPLSKSLVYHFSNKNIQSYDIGFGLRYLWDTADYSHRI
jgi:hypothetical protein